MINFDILKLQVEVERLRAENAWLTEIAAEKATRMDELYEALDELVEDLVLEAYEPSSELIEAKKVLNKNNPDGDVSI